MAEDEHKPTKRVNLARDILNDDYSHSSVPDERPVIIDEEGIKGKETNDELATKTNQNIFKKKWNLKPFFMMIALSTHAIFEGIALGLTSEWVSACIFGTAIFIHKWAEAVSLGVTF